jgi:hypothetical protein
VNVVSAYAAPLSETDAGLAAAVIAKPFDVDDLLRRVDPVLERGFTCNDEMRDYGGEPRRLCGPDTSSA